MIVDVHTHTPTHVQAVPEDDVKHYGGWNNSGRVKVTFSWQEYLDGTSAADYSIVFNIKRRAGSADELGDVHDNSTANETTAALAAAYPNRIVGFMSLIPDEPGVVEELEQCVEWGLKGIKLGPNYQRFDPLTKEAFALYSIAEKNGLPILFHQGTSPDRWAPLRWAHPLLMDEIAIAFPDLKIVMAHIGHPWTRETIVTIRKHPNVYADVSAIYARPVMLYEALTQASEWGVLHKLLFGSDFPVTTPAQAISALRQANDIVEGTRMPRIPAEAIESIIHANAFAALGLEVPGKAVA